MSGSIPSIISDLKSLVHLYLDNNQLSGSIPEEFYTLSKMVTLSLSSNRVSGPLVNPKLSAGFPSLLTCAVDSTVCITSFDNTTSACGSLSLCSTDCEIVSSAWTAMQGSAGSKPSISARSSCCGSYGVSCESLKVTKM